MQNVFFHFHPQRMIVQSHFNVIPFIFLVKDSNNFITQSLSITVPTPEESEVQRPLIEKPCSPQKTEKLTQPVKSTLSQPVQSKEEPVKGTHVQLEPKDKPTTPGKLSFSCNESLFKPPVLEKLHAS